MYVLALLARTVREFLAWWLGTLASMVPRRVRNWLAPTVAHHVLDFRDADVVVSRAGRRRSEVLARLPRSPAEGGGDWEATPELPGDRAAIPSLIRLPASVGLRKRLTFPATIERDLAQALRFDMDRLTPFTADQVMFDYRVGRRDRAAKQITVDLLAVPRALIDPVVEQARAWGFRPARIDLTEGALNEADWRLPLGVARRKPIFSWANASWSLACVAVVLAFATALYPLHQKHQQLGDLQQQLADARKEAAVVSALRESVERTRQDTRFIFEKKLERPPFVQVLNEVTRVIPDHTWLYRLRYQSGDLQVFGHSEIASELIANLEASPMLVNARFNAPTTRDRRTDKERFHIACRVAPEAET